MRSPRLLAAAALASIIALSGCDKARPLPAPADPTSGCLSCHGGQENSSGAPPWSLPRNAAGDIVAGGTQFGNTAATTQIEVGAHTRHVSRGVSCGACHVVPVMINSPGHNTGNRATVTFKELAAAGNVVPAPWVPAVHTCSNYCHGASLNHGGSSQTPDWLGGAAAAACGTCHFAAGVTPPAQHPQGSGGAGYPDTRACATCHTETVDAATGEINLAGGKHVNGQLDGGGGHPAGWADPANHGPAANAGLPACAVCHGSAFDGGTAGVSCTACHASAGHPYWQSECTFCHGSTTRNADTVNFPLVPTPLPAGANASLQVRANLASPPVGSQGETNTTSYAVGAHQAHVSPTRFANAMSCAECHGPTLPADVTHVGGTVLVLWGATASAANTIPSPAAGNLPRWNDTSLPPGGANCTNYCHGATLGGGAGTLASPKWNQGASGASCGSCHTLPPPYAAAGGWHVPRSDCGTCHGGYPSSPTAASNIVGGALATHVDGSVQVVALGCTTCHGGTNTAPPNDTAGNGTGVKVGAHQQHLATTLTAATLGCGECHPAVSNPRHANGVVNISWNLGATVWSGATFPAVTPAAGPLSAAWESAPTCANYCHGGFTNGKAASVSWTSAVAMTCNSCHGAAAATVTTASLPGGTHPQGTTDCSICHTGYSTTTVNGAVHLDGKYDVSAASCTACHGAKGAYTAIPGADTLVTAAPPTDNTGAATGVKVGAHQAHVNQATYRTNPLACADCHPIPNAHNGSRDAAWSALATNTIINGTPISMAPTPAAATGFTTAWEGTPTCTNACHGGNIPSNASRPAPLWTGGALTCASCHGAPPPLSPTANQTHPQNTSCGSCHGAGYSATTVNKANHVNGTLNRVTSGCTACHGELPVAGVTLTANTVAAAPGATGTNTVDTTGASLTTADGVGAHRAHLTGTTFRAAPLACTECHALPPSNADVAHATGAGTGGARATITWGNIASAATFGARSPSYTRPSCASTYCHAPRADTVPGLNQAPSWVAAGTVVCGDCHGLPPSAAGHAANPACSQCHPSYPDNPTGTTVLSAAAKLIHINGQLDGGESTGASPCLNCHKTDAATGAAYGRMVGDTTVYHHVMSAETGAFQTYPVTSAGKACLNCHADHDVFNPALNPLNTLGRGGNLRTTIATAPTKVAPATGNYANTDFSGTAGLCLSCHSASMAKSTTAQKSDGSTTTHVISGASFGTSAHAYLVAGSITTGGSAINAVCMKCHSDQQTATYPEKQNGTYRFALHTSVDRRLRNPMGQVTPTDDRSEDHCFRCHSLTTDTSPGGGPAKAVANRDYFNASAMTVSSQNVFKAFTDATHVSRHNVAGYDLIHQPTEAPAGAGGVKHVECEDCHEPHAARAGAKAATNQNTVWGPLTGVTGVVPTWSTANWTVPTAYAATTSSTYEYQICFKCHSGANANLAAWDATWTNLALEFSPANQSRHPVVSALPAGTDSSATATNQLVAAQLINGWTPGQVMTCSDCHGADASSPAAQGPHGSAVRYMLKGTNRAWPYTVAGATTGTLFKLSTSETNLGNANGNGLFCRNCHPQMNSAGSNSIHRHGDLTGGQHGGSANVPACANCHLRVPHGGKVSRLMVTTNAPARYRTGTANLAGFTKLAKDSYTVSNSMRTSCAEHSGGTGAEAW